MDIVTMLRTWMSAKSKGVLLQLPAVFVGVMIAVIMLYLVTLPTVNTGITSSTANLAGYPGAQTISTQIPLMLVLTLLVSIAAVVIRSVSG